MSKHNKCLGGDEASNEGCNSGPTGHDFMDNSILLFKMKSTKVIDYSAAKVLRWVVGKVQD